MTLQMLFYPGFILILAIFTLITVPRSEFRDLMPYGIVLGGLVDFVSSLIFGTMFKMYTYSNHGIFNVGGHIILASLAWTLVMIVYLYFWPRNNRNLTYFYIAAWAGLATGFSQIVRGIDLFDYSPWYYPLPMLIVHITWFSLAAWVAKPWTNS